MWKKFLLKLCGLIEHAISYFAVQLELHNTFLQEIMFRRVCITEPPKTYITAFR